MTRPAHGRRADRPPRAEDAALVGSPCRLARRERRRCALFRTESALSEALAVPDSPLHPMEAECRGRSNSRLMKARGPSGEIGPV